jgi:hypothetical protein
MWNTGITELWLIQEQEDMRRRELRSAHRAALRDMPLRGRYLRPLTRIRRDRRDSA